LVSNCSMNCVDAGNDNAAALSVSDLDTRLDISSVLIMHTVRRIVHRSLMCVFLGLWLN